MGGGRKKEGGEYERLEVGFGRKDVEYMEGKGEMWFGERGDGRVDRDNSGNEMVSVSAFRRSSMTYGSHMEGITGTTLAEHGLLTFTDLFELRIVVHLSCYSLLSLNVPCLYSVWHRKLVA